MHGGSIKALKHMEKVSTDGQRAIAPVVPELIKKQDHTPVQSSEGAERRRSESLPSFLRHCITHVNTTFFATK